MSGEVAQVFQSTSITKLCAALVKAQGSLKPAIKESSNPFFKSKYADLGAVWDACRDALQENGLAVVQFPGFSDAGAALLTTILLHDSGEYISATAGAPLVKPDAQSVGSALTYLRRYALASVVGVVTEDDDGNAASAKAETPKRAQMPKPQPKTPAGVPVMKFGKSKGTPLKDVSRDILLAARLHCVQLGTEQAHIDELDTELASREEP